jgi:hypothetical protein
MLRQLCIVALVAGAVGGVHAQTPTASQGGGPPKAGSPAANPAPPAPTDPSDSLSDAELAAALDAYAIVQAQQHLSISDEKYRTFAARFKRVQNIRRRNQRIRVGLVQQLRKMAGARAETPIDETAIRAQLTALREHDERSAAELRQAYDAVDEVLDTRQQARFRLFEEEIERRKLDLLVRARQRVLQNKRQ